MKLAVIGLAMAVAGCATSRPMPRDVEIMPTDCVNRVQILNWLDYQLKLPRAVLQDQQDYERQQSQIRYRIWSMRYRCQPV